MAATQSIKRAHRFRPKKRLGQHFIKNTGIIHEIIARAQFDKSDRILEIGDQGLVIARIGDGGNQPGKGGSGSTLALKTLT